MMDKLIHALGITSLRELVVYIGIAWFSIFIVFMLLLYPFVELGIFSLDFIIFLIPFLLVLSLLLAILSMNIPLYVKKEDIDKNFPFFVVFMNSMATSKTSYDEFFSTMAETKEFGEISKEMKRLYHLAKDWKLGYSKACKVVADTTPSPVFSDFLARLSQVVEYGEDVVLFFQTQFRDILRSIYTMYQESIYKISTVAELFSALMVAIAFILAFIAMLPIFFPVPEVYLYAAYAGSILLVNVVIFVAARASVPPDKLANDFPDISPEHMTAIIATAIGVVLSLIVFAAGLLMGLDPIITVALTVVPLIVPAYLSRRAEMLIRRREQSYLPFIRTFGELVQIREGAVIPVVRRLRRHTYLGMNEALERLYRRLAITRNVFTSFRLFSKELGSAILTKFNELFVKALYAGADPKATGNIIGDQLHVLLDARKLRSQTAGGARGMIYGTYWGVALGVFLAVKALASMFDMLKNTFASIMEGEAAAMINFALNFNVNLWPMVNMMVYIFAVEAVILSIMIKVLDGGLKVGATFHYVILVLGLLIVYYLTDIAVALITPTSGAVEITTG